jgi:HAD superfamily hydrolase (TIGR01509 family)
MSSPGLAHALAGDGPILLDFDGPVCRIFAGYPARVVAAELRALLTGKDVHLRPEVAHEDDPLQILRWTASLDRPSLIQATEDALRGAELMAALTATPEPYSHEVFVAAQRAKRQVAIVSNNSEPAIRAYLAAHRLAEYVSYVAGRKPYDPQKMKPHPFLIKQALNAVHAESHDAVLIGDSMTDIAAARAAGVRVVGYANSPSKLSSFPAASPDAIVPNLADLVAAL